MPDLQTKNLAEVPVLTNTEEGMNVLVENNGEIKKINCTKIGTGESGSGGGVLILTAEGYENPNGGVSVRVDKTAREIKEAIEAGRTIVFREINPDDPYGAYVTYSGALSITMYNNLETNEWSGTIYVSYSSEFSPRELKFSSLEEKPTDFLG